MKLRQYSSYLGGRKVTVSSLNVELRPDADWRTRLGCIVVYRGGHAVIKRESLPLWATVAERVIVPDGEVQP